ncbi:MAG: diguanylate cyclase [bacterium]
MTVDKWKQKYLESLDKMDHAEKSWNQQSSLMKQAMVRVSLAASDIDNDLDKALLKLREAVRNDVSPPQFERVVAYVSDVLIKLDKRQQRSRNELKHAAESVLKPLDRHKLGFNGRRKYKKLLKNLPTKQNQSINFLGELADLLRTTIGKIPNKETNSVTGLDEEMLSTIQSELKELMNCLRVPEGMDDQVAAVRQQLNGSFQCEDLPDAISSITALFKETYVLEQERFEAFATHLAERFEEFEQFLEGSEESEGQLDTIHDNLDKGMRQGIQGISKSIREAKTLEGVQQAVEQHMIDMVGRLNKFKKANKARKEELNSRFHEMRTQLHSVSEEANSLRAAVAEERARGLKDPLTLVGNREAYNIRFNAEFEKWEHYNTLVSLLVVDIDHFKHVNDTYGHQAGDKVLRVVAGILEDQTRDNDFVGRYGGEEFAVILPGVSLEKAKVVAEKLRKAVKNCPFEGDGHKVMVTISIGVTVTQNGDTKDEFFNRADKAMYKAKQEGRDQICSG